MYSDQELLKMLPGYTNQYAEANGIRLHYVEGGVGEALVLIPGWPENWWAYHKIMPLLSLKYSVLVVEPRGMGSSEKPLAGYDKKNMAKDIYELAQKSGHRKIHICGHDIGAHVAFSFAANYQEATGKLIMLDTPHPDETMYQLPMLPITGMNYTYPWWLAFNQVKELPEVLLAGRMRVVIDWIFKSLLNNQNSLSDFDKGVYSHAYDSTEDIRASNAWYQAFAQDIQDSKAYPKIKTPVLGIACSNSYEMLSASLTKFATDISMKKIEDSGHFLLAEKPEEVAAQIMEFLG
ncbi:alpha/beta hydrolase [Chitinophaga sp. 212800010-3]|uniref:alpha/beta fold hydrolase n=1 Tax=unclassified Chitinophaga TaxID=2619133 RepID=UPI002DF5F8CA|nr:Soluble epoxide hydrolase [Chitinophaga sp. 212800010-3]